MNILEYLVKATTKHPKITILIALLITSLALIPASNFAIDSNVESMFESDDPDIKMMEDIDERFGEQELVTVVIDCSNSNPSTAESYVETLVEKLKKDKRFKNIQYKEDFSFAGEKGILYLPEEYLLMLTDPNITLDMVNDYRISLYENPNYIVSENGKIYLINMGINVAITDAEDRESLFDDLGDLIEETKEENNDYKDLILGFTGGMMVIDYEGDKLAFGDFFLTAGITVVLILLLLLFSFKSLSIPIL
ncbi:MAG: MMPL family transporter, partial [Methanomicrobia archaeon]|nr:MMPL family transporter [Methanomicrobia archaeon]